MTAPFADADVTNEDGLQSMVDKWLAIESEVGHAHEDRLTPTVPCTVVNAPCSAHPLDLRNCRVGARRLQIEEGQENIEMEALEAMTEAVRTLGRHAGVGASCVGF